MSDIPVPPVKPEPPYFSYALALLGAPLLLLGIYHGLAATYEWLRYGTSLPVRIRDVWRAAGLGEPHVEWVGVQKIVNGYMELSAGTGLFVTGLVLCAISGWLYGLSDPERDDYRRKKWEYEAAVERAKKRAEAKPNGS
jgi:hypothetical protein